LLITF